LGIKVQDERVFDREPNRIVALRLRDLHASPRRADDRGAPHIQEGNLGRGAPRQAQARRAVAHVRQKGTVRVDYATSHFGADLGIVRATRLAAFALSPLHPRERCTHRRRVHSSEEDNIVKRQRRSDLSLTDPRNGQRQHPHGQNGVPEFVLPQQ
jgi:hypothetical protein